MYKRQPINCLAYYIFFGTETLPFLTFFLSHIIIRIIIIIIFFLFFFLFLFFSCFLSNTHITHLLVVIVQSNRKIETEIESHKGLPSRVLNAASLRIIAAMASCPCPTHSDTSSSTLKRLPCASATSRLQSWSSRYRTALSLPV